MIILDPPSFDCSPVILLKIYFLLYVMPVLKIQLPSILLFITGCLQGIFMVF